MTSKMPRSINNHWFRAQSCLWNSTFQGESVLDSIWKNRLSQDTIEFRILSHVNKCHFEQIAQETDGFFSTMSLT